MPQESINDQVNIGSGNGLVLSGTKPLPEPMLNKFDQLATMSQLQLCISYWVTSLSHVPIDYMSWEHSE